MADGSAKASVNLYSANIARHKTPRQHRNAEGDYEDRKCKYTLERTVELHHPRTAESEPCDPLGSKGDGQHNKRCPK